MKRFRQSISDYYKGECQLNSLIREKREELQAAFYDLDYLKTYECSLELIEKFPGEHSLFTHLKDLLQFMHSGYRDQLDYQRCMYAIDGSLNAIPQSPIAHECKSILYKLMEDYPRAEEHAFRTVYFNKNLTNLENHRSFLFELAYIWKNMGFLDIFTRLTFSIPFNLMLMRAFRQVAFTDEILKKRLYSLDFGKSPVQNAAILKQQGDKFYLISAGSNKRNAREVLRYLKVLDAQKIEFDFYHLLSKEEYLLFNKEAPQSLMVKIPPRITDCPAAIRTEGFTLVICQEFEPFARPILERLDTYWKVRVEKSDFCQCR